MKGALSNAVRAKDTYRCIVFGSCIRISCVIGRDMERVAGKVVALWPDIIRMCRQQPQRRPLSNCY